MIGLYLVYLYSILATLSRHLSIIINYAMTQQPRLLNNQEKIQVIEEFPARYFIFLYGGLCGFFGGFFFSSSSTT